VPAEIRHIVFSPAEIAAGIREYRRRMGHPLPPGLLRDILLRDGGGAGVRAALDIVPEHGCAAECWEIGTAELTAAMVLYCGDHKIPLPAAGTKGLQKFADSLLLIVTINVSGAGWPLSAGLSLAREHA
jgi:hypothetical protein